MDYDQKKELCLLEYGSLKNLYAMNIADWPPVIYVVRVTNSEFSETLKWIKQ